MVERIDDLAGLSSKRFAHGCVCSGYFDVLAGWCMPWMGGFIGKWFVFSAAIEAGLYPLAIIGILASVVGAFYYLRIVKIMFFDDPAPVFERPSNELRSRVWSSVDCFHGNDGVLCKSDPLRLLNWPRTVSSDPVGLCTCLDKFVSLLRDSDRLL